MKNVNHIGECNEKKDKNLWIRDDLKVSRVVL